MAKRGAPLASAAPYICMIRSMTLGTVEMVLCHFFMAKHIPRWQKEEELSRKSLAYRFYLAKNVADTRYRRSTAIFFIGLHIRPFLSIFVFE